MKCRHIVAGKPCGATIRAPATQCQQCGGKACPKCSTSVVEELRTCCNCGWKLKTGFKFLIIERNCCGKTELLFNLYV